MAYSPSRGLLYSAPPAHDDERRTDEERAVDADAGAAPTPADD